MAKPASIDFDELAHLELADEDTDLPTRDHSSCLKTGILQKKMMGRGIVWHSYKAVLTPSMLGFARKVGAEVDESDMRMIDHIPLHRVSAVHYVSDFLGAMRSEEQALRHKAKKIDSLLYSEAITRHQAVVSGGLCAKVMDDVTTEDFAILITTVEGDGVTPGRACVYRAASQNEIETWYQAIISASSECKRQYEEHLRRSLIGHSCFRRMRMSAHDLHQAPRWKVFVSFIVLATFGTDIWEAEFIYQDWTGKETELELYKDVVFLCDIAFNIFFLLELGINLIANTDGTCGSFLGWLQKPWNMMDIALNSLAILSFITDPFLRQLRPVRVLRISRFFRKYPSINRIVSSLGRAMKGLLSAFALLMMTNCVFAVLATDLYRTDNPIFFRDFSTSFFTMFQVASGDSWASAVVRSLFDARDSSGEAKIDPGVALFFCSYMIISGTILMNVVIAVLLDQFVESMHQEKEERHAAKSQQKEDEIAAVRVQGSMDPLLKSLCRFATAEDLHCKIDRLFQYLDKTGNGSLDHRELHHGLKAMMFSPPIILTEDDFDMLTAGRSLCNEEGEFNAQQFHQMIEGEMQRYALRELSTAMNEGDKQVSRLCVVLKMLAVNVGQLRADPSTSGGAKAGHLAAAALLNQSRSTEDGQDVPTRESRGTVRNMTRALQASDAITRRKDRKPNDDRKGAEGTFVADEELAEPPSNGYLDDDGVGKDVTETQRERRDLLLEIASMVRSSVGQTCEKMLQQAETRQLLLLNRTERQIQNLEKMMDALHQHTEQSFQRLLAKMDDIQQTNAPFKAALTHRSNEGSLQAPHKEKLTSYLTSEQSESSRTRIVPSLRSRRPSREQIEQEIEETQSTLDANDKIRSALHFALTSRPDREVNVQHSNAAVYSKVQKQAKDGLPLSTTSFMVAEGSEGPGVTHFVHKRR